MSYSKLYLLLFLVALQTDCNIPLIILTAYEQYYMHRNTHERHSKYAKIMTGTHTENPTWHLEQGVTPPIPLSSRLRKRRKLWHCVSHIPNLAIFFCDTKKAPILKHGYAKVFKQENETSLLQHCHDMDKKAEYFTNPQAHLFNGFTQNIRHSCSSKARIQC